MSNAKFIKAQEVGLAKPRLERSPLSEIEQMIEDCFPRHRMGQIDYELPHWPDFRRQSEIQSPRVDVINRNNELIVRAEMPGIPKDEIRVSLTENNVTIRSETKKEDRVEEGDYHRCEISRDVFSRTVALPTYVDSKKSKAKFKDGILELTLPKTEKNKRMELKIEG